MRKTILSLFVLLLIIIYDVRCSYSQPALDNNKYPKDSWIEEIPIVCNEADVLEKFLIEKGWYAVERHSGKEEANETGRLVYVIIVYNNDNIKGSTLSTITVASGESCILYTAFDKTSIKKNQLKI